MSPNFIKDKKKGEKYGNNVRGTNNQTVPKLYSQYVKFQWCLPQSWGAFELENDIAADGLHEYRRGIPAWHNRRRHPLIASALYLSAFCQKFLLRGDPAEGSVAKMRFFLFLEPTSSSSSPLFILFIFIYLIIIFNCVCVYGIHCERLEEVNIIDPCFSEPE